MKIPNLGSRKNRILLKELVKTDFKLRYQGSLLGYLWAVLRPMMLFAILYVVFAKILKMGSDIPHYPVYLLAGTVLWSFFSECTNQGIQAIVARGDLLRKISFPKWIIVVSATVTALINFLINLGVVIIFAIINGVTPNLGWLLVPLIILELYLLSLGISFFLGAINVKYRDISAVPVIYPITMVASASPLAAKIFLLNPIAQVIQDVRYFLITDQTITTWHYLENRLLYLIPLGLVSLVIILGGIYFRKRSKYFAEEA